MANSQTDYTMMLLFNHSKIVKKVLQKEFKRLDIPFEAVSSSEVKPVGNPCKEKMKILKKRLAEYGIQVVEDPKEKLVAKIKEVIHQMVYSENNLPTTKNSVLLSEKLGYSYGYLSTIFSESTLISIENYIILKKIELVKLYLLRNDVSITETAFKLNYSSVGHLCNQFKKKTGLTPSEYQSIMSKRIAAFV